jgi:hypothetical protein
MSTLASTPNIDPEPILRHMAAKGGNCSFEEAMQLYLRLGMTPTQARDALWRLLSDGAIEFTVDRRLRVPKATNP